MLPRNHLIESLAQARRPDLSEPLDAYLRVAEALEKTARHEEKARASFIRDQCRGFDGRTLFSRYQEKWGIPKFKEALVDAADFRRGFLFCFRDHSANWADSAEAWKWFLSSPEAAFIRRYEYWTRDKGPARCLRVYEGSYREVLKLLLKEGRLEVLVSPAIPAAEVEGFLKTYRAKKGAPSKSELMDLLHLSRPGWIS
jgi:hypothetical protein